MTDELPKKETQMGAETTNIKAMCDGCGKEAEFVSGGGAFAELYGCVGCVRRSEREADVDPSISQGPWVGVHAGEQTPLGGQKILGRCRVVEVQARSSTVPYVVVKIDGRDFAENVLRREFNRPPKAGDRGTARYVRSGSSGTICVALDEETPEAKAVTVAHRFVEKLFEGTRADQVERHLSKDEVFEIVRGAYEIGLFDGRKERAS